jgi:uncharacterized lipoprotein
MKKLLTGLALTLLFAACSSDSADKTRVRETSGARSGSATNANDRRLPPNINMKNWSVDHRN